MALHLLCSLKSAQQHKAGRCWETEQSLQQTKTVLRYYTTSDEKEEEKPQHASGFSVHVQELASQFQH